jgi:protein-tyrosine phosphatase
MNHENGMIITGEHMHEILPRLWVGDVHACELARGRGFKCLCVLENAHTEDKQCEHIRILSEAGGTTNSAPAKLLDHAAAWLFHNWFIEQRHCLVHCGAGVERSPLTVVWFMAKIYSLNLPDAYAWVMKHRPEAQDRSTWVSHESLESFLNTRGSGA